MYFTQCSYKGQRSINGKQMHGFGCYRFAITSTASLRSITSAAKSGAAGTNADQPSGGGGSQTTCYYCGSFKNGAFDGPGILFFASESGGGQYRGYWRAGELVHEMPATNTTTAADGEPQTFYENSYVFSDGLRMVFPKESWSYGVEGEDRRFWVEYLEGLLPTMPEETRLGGKRALEILQKSRFAKPAGSTEVNCDAADSQNSQLVHIGPKSKVLRSVAVQAEILPGARLVERYGITSSADDEINAGLREAEKAAKDTDSSVKKELQVPEAFRENRPRAFQDVPSSLWSEPPAAKPESEFLAMVLEDLAREAEQRAAPESENHKNGSTQPSGKHASNIGKELSSREVDAAHQVDEKMNMTADVASMVSQLKSH